MTEKRITLENLIEAGIIAPPFSIHVNFKGKKFTAKIDKDGFVLMEGKRYTSLSIAGGIVRALVSGKPHDGLPYRRVNGWNFWKYIDSNGEERRIQSLREGYRKEKKS